MEDKNKNIEAENPEEKGLDEHDSPERVPGEEMDPETISVDGVSLDPGEDTVLPVRVDSLDAVPSSIHGDKLKDILGREFLRHNDIFADVVNVLVFKGKEYVKPEDLESEDTHSVLVYRDEYMGQERDLLKIWKGPDGKPIAYLGEESQSKLDNEMAMRGSSYDGGTYLWIRKKRADVARENTKLRKAGRFNEIRPLPLRASVISFTLYPGEEPWPGERISIKDSLEFPEGVDDEIMVAVRKAAGEYKAWVFDIPRLAPETVKMFKSDFRYLAEYLVSDELMKNGKESIFTGTVDKIVHLQDFVNVMEALTGKDFWRQLSAVSEEKGDEPMHTFMIDQAEAGGRAEEGRRDGQLIKILVNAGRTADLLQAADDPDYKQKLFAELGIVKSEESE